MKRRVSAYNLLAIILCIVLVLSACSGGGSNEPASADQNNGTATETEGSNEPAAETSEPAKEEAPPAKDVTLKIMFQKKEGGDDIFFNWMQDNIKLYQEQHPNVKFETTANTCCDQYLTVVTTAMAANDLPDIFQGWTLERQRPFAEAGRLLDLKPYFDADPDWSAKLDMLDSTSFNGGTYGIPLERALEIVFYNKKVFEENGLTPPKTYDEFLNIVDVLSSEGITPMTVPNKEPWVGSIPYMMLLERVGGMEAYEATVMNKTGKWTDEPFIKAGEMLQDLIKRGAFEDNVNSITTKESEIKLSEGKAGMYAMGTWSIATLTNLMGDNLGFFNFPAVEGGKGGTDHWIILPNSALSVAAKSKNPDEAVDFLKFVFSQERQLEFAKLGYITGYKTETKPGDLSEFNTTLLNELATNNTAGMYPWDVPLGVFMGKELNNTTQSLYIGANPKEAFEKLQQIQDSQQ